MEVQLPIGKYSFVIEARVNTLPKQFDSSCLSRVIQLRSITALLETEHEIISHSVRLGAHARGEGRPNFLASTYTRSVSRFHEVLK